MAENLLTNHLTPAQKKKKKYKIKRTADNSIIVTSKQRSFTNNMLRKYLGSDKVATFIWKFGVPPVLDGALRSLRCGSHAALRANIKDCLEWWTRLIIAVTAHAEKPDLQTQHRISSLSKEDKLWKERRRSLLAKLKQDMKNGKRLAEERDSNKRKFADMEAREQQVLEDWETGKIEKKTQRNLSTKKRISKLSAISDLQQWLSVKSASQQDGLPPLACLFSRSSIFLQSAASQRGWLS